MKRGRSTGKPTVAQQQRMAEWMAAVPRLPNRDEILRNARTTADGLSPAELETLDIDAMARELGVPLDAPAPDSTAANARAQVQQSVMAQLVGTERYTPAQAESQAQLWGAMFGRLGEVTGQDPVALYERYAAGIDAAEAPAEGAESQPRTLMQRGMDALRSLFGRPQVATDGRGQQTIERDGSAYVQRAGQWLLADEQGQARDFLTLDQARTEAERIGGEIVQDDPIDGQRQTWSVALPDAAAREVLAGDILFQPTRTDEVPTGLAPDTPVPVIELEPTTGNPAEWFAESNELMRTQQDGTEVTAPDGQPVRFASRGRKKVMSKGRRDPLRQAVARELPALVESAPIHATSIDTDDKTVSYAYAASAVQYDGQVYPVRLVYRVGNDGVRRAYDFEGFEIGNPDGLGSEALRQSGSDVGAMERAGTAESELRTRGLPTSGLTLSEVLPAFNARPFFQSSEAAPRGQIQIGPGRSMQISLFRGADLSTFLHESGHFFLEVYRDLATAEDAAPQLRSDLDALLKWFGVESADQIGVDQHEQFARGFEAYLGEGRAPTPELQSVFSQFKQWILGVYRSLRNLDVELTDEVRGVFDRMLASQEEIDAAHARVGFEPIARDLAEAQALGMTERQFADYQAQVAAAREQAEADLMAQLQEADARARERWWKDELANIRSEVEAEVEAMPIVRAYRVLTGRKEAAGEPVPEQLQGLKLDRAVLAATYGDGLLEKMGRVTAKEGGMPPSDVAALLGFANGDDLVQGLWTVQQTLAGVKAEAEARMRSRHGDPLTDGTLPNRALAAMHSNSRLRLLERELGLLADLAREPRLNRRQLRVVAEAVLAKKPVGAIRPNEFLVAERKAARSAAVAAAKGRYVEALQAKRQQAFNAVLYRNATEAVDAAQRIAKRATRLTRGPAQERLAKAGNGFLPNINGLLAAYGFGGSPSIEGAALADWVETLQDSGEVTAVSDAVIARLDSPANFADVPLSEVREFGEAIKNLSHLASRQNQLLAGARKADKESAIAEMLSRSTSVLGEAREFVAADDLPAGARAARTAGGLLDDIDRPESILEKLDGGETGPWHDFIWHAQEQAESKKSELMRRVGTQLKQLHSGLPKNWEDNLRQVATFKGVAMTRRRLIGMALNLGNAGNRQRLMEGGFTTSTRTILLSEGDLNSLAAMLSPTELRYVQGMWDAIGSMRPDIEALNARMGGVPVQFVEAVPFDVQMPSGEVVHMAGGYFPLAYDSTRSVVGDVQANEDAMKVLMATGAGRAATSKGYVKGRAETVKAALNLDYGLVVNRHLDQVMTDLAYREAVRDVHMLLNDPRIKNYVSSRVSPSALRSLTGGLAYSVVGSTEAAGNVAKWRAFGDGLLANTTVAALALRPDIALGNYGSALVQGIDRSSTSSVLRSFAKFQTHRTELTREIVEKSPFMAAKLQEVDHMYATTIGKIRGDRWKGAHAGYTRLMMTLHRLADADVSRVVWLARYETERRKGTPDVDAVKLADKAIRMTQTATAKKDLSTFERDPALRQTRQYMGPMFVIFGRLRAATEGSGAARVGSARVASLFLQWVLAPTVFALLAGRLPGDEDDDGEKDWMTWMVTEVGLFPLQTVPLVRDVASIAESVLAGRPPNSRSAPLATAINNMGKATQRIAKRWDSGESFSDSWDEYTVDLLQLAGPLLGAPSTQARKWDKAYNELWDDPDTGTLELTQMAVYGETPYYDDGELLPDQRTR